MNQALLILAAIILTLPASARESIFPPGFCGDNSVVREISSEEAVNLIGEASRRKLNSLQFLADPGFASGCVYNIGPAALEAIDNAFIMDLATPLSGKATNGQVFRMKSMVLGRSKLKMTYDRDRVEYYNKRSDRTLGLGRTVSMEVLVSLDEKTIWLNNVQKLQVSTLIGWYDVERVRQSDGRIESYVRNDWREGIPATAIVRRAAASAARIAVWPAMPSLELLGRLSRSAVFPR
ncbi:MAG: hypothetical protein PHF00_04375 [Elusimicrobia bacterium]|nr:hypothetical protein [Elusimicrobiota bacterium]